MNSSEQPKYLMLNPIHNCFYYPPMIIDPNKCDNNFKIDIYKHLSILTAVKYYAQHKDISNPNSYFFCLKTKN